jgi:DNA polymerase III subunit gamma/tau
MSYTVLARRYRSQSFDDVVGQEAVAKTLKNAITSDRVAHAYLFTGTRGVGKTTMARILAKALNCLESAKPTPTPCCTCESCVAINEGEDIDVLEIDGASNTGVEHIRELRQNAIYRPARARYKIYIIDEVHMLSTSAFNALLKTLEEPPDHVKFIFATTEPNKILPTILSRCQRFDFRALSRDQIAHQLGEVLIKEKIEAEPALISRLSRLANGSMRDALSLLDQMLSMTDQTLTLGLLHELLGTPRQQRLIDLIGAFADSNMAEALRQVDQAVNEGLALETLAQSLQQRFRDLLILRTCGAKTDLVDFDDENDLRKMAEFSAKFDESALVYYITMMEELRRGLRSGEAGRALFEAAMVRMTASDRFSDTRTLLEELRQWQPGETPAANPAKPIAAAAPQAGSQSSGLAKTERGHVPHGRPEGLPSPPSPAANTPAAPPQGDFQPPAEMTLEIFQQQWASIIAALGRQGGFINGSQPIGWENGRLTILFDPASRDKCSLLQGQAGIRRDVEKALAAVLRTGEVSLEAQLPASGAAPARSAAGTSPPGSKPSQKEVNQTLADPQVVTVQRILGGKVRQIDRLNQ